MAINWISGKLKKPEWKLSFDEIFNEQTSFAKGLLESILAENDGTDNTNTNDLLSPEELV
jgi:hypothetical protein